MVSLVVSVSLFASEPKQKGRATLLAPVITMDGGRRLEFVGTFSSEKELKGSRSFWKRVVDAVAGPPNYGRLIRPYAVTLDSRGRIIITDPGAMAVHIFDFANKQYRRLRGGKGKDMLSPIEAAVDAQDNIYVADSSSGRIFVFEPRGKFSRFIGAVTKQEGYFKRPTGIAIDKQKGELFVTDTLRDEIFVLDLQGHVLRKFGGQGSGPGQFNFPTEIVLRGGELYVVDAMNFRVQILTTQGKYITQFGELGEGMGRIFRPKGLSIDSEGDVYLVEASLGAVQVFSRDGTLLYTFGKTGTGPGDMELPSGLWIDANDRIYVADSYNQRIQVFQFTSAQHANGGQH
jgi:DNA-binding beta-propeller fold protein YncE